MRPMTVISLVALATFSATAAFAACDDRAPRRGKVSDRERCPPTKRFEPYDPDRMRGGSRAGTIDIGGGTEVRIGGRTRFEYQYTR